MFRGLSVEDVRRAIPFPYTSVQDLGAVKV